MKNKEYLKIKIKENKKAIVLLSLLSIISSASSVCFAYVSKYLLDNFNNKNKLVLFSLVLLSIILIEILFRLIESIIQIKKTYVLEKKIKEETFDTILRKKYKDIKENKDSDTITKIISDSRIISGGIIGFVPKVVSLLTMIILSLIFLYMIDYIFASILLAFGIIIFFISRILRKKNKELSKEVLKRDADTLSFYNESITNLLLLKVYNKHNNLKENENQVNERLKKSKEKRSLYNVYVGSGFTLFSRLSYLFTIGYGVIMYYLTLNDKALIPLSIGALLSLIQLVLRIESPITSLSSILPSYYSILGSIDRIIEINNLEDSINNELDDFENITVNNISFSYDNKNVIKDLSFEIKKNDFILISGESGKGKTTLIKLIMGLYEPDSGEILFDNSIKTSTISNMFSYVPQNNYIFEGTLKDNIKFFNNDLSDEKIIEYLNLLGLSKFSNELDKTVYDLNKGMSEGELQRLSIIRALASNRKILVLDEATSALDKENEELLLNNLSKINKTIIFISHKEIRKELITKEIKL